MLKFILICEWWWITQWCCTWKQHKQLPLWCHYSSSYPQNFVNNVLISVIVSFAQRFAKNLQRNLRHKLSQSLDRLLLKTTVITIFACDLYYENSRWASEQLTGVCSTVGVPSFLFDPIHWAVRRTSSSSIFVCSSCTFRSCCVSTSPGSVPPTISFRYCWSILSMAAFRSFLKPWRQEVRSTHYHQSCLQSIQNKYDKDTV